ncbi:aminotransferase [Arthrobacter sp. Hiyo8]|nr:aminotransferase [Arthrobacter sp. Hiyo8]
MNETVGLSPTGAAEAAATTLVSQSTGSDWLARYSSSLMGVFGTPQRSWSVAREPSCGTPTARNTWTSSAGLP